MPLLYIFTLLQHARFSRITFKYYLLKLVTVFFSNFRAYSVFYVFQLPPSPQRTHVSSLLERVPMLCNKLVVTIKSPTVGKAATFGKVDGVIQETKDLMNTVTKLVDACTVSTELVNDSPVTSLIVSDSVKHVFLQAGLHILINL